MRIIAAKMAFPSEMRATLRAQLCWEKKFGLGGALPFLEASPSVMERL